MAATLDTTTVTVSVAAQLLNALDLGTAKAPSGLKRTYTFTNGTGANQAGNVFADQRTTDDTGESLDLSGVLTNAFGEVVSFTSVKALIIRADAANTVDVVVGAGGVNSFVGWVGDASDTVVIKPGGMFALIAPDATGYPVTAGTGDLLQIAASATGNVTYDVVVIGEV